MTVTHRGLRFLVVVRSGLPRFARNDPSWGGGGWGAGYWLAAQRGDVLGHGLGALRRLD